MIINLLVIFVTISISLFLFSKRIRNSRLWCVTITPLASIIGSGFLVIAPLLAQITGRYLLVGIIILVFVGLACGSVIRFNILNVEPLLKENKKSLFHDIERFSKIVLGIAYIISISFYLQLLSSFLLKVLYKENLIYQHLLTTLILMAIALIGKFRGFNMLERIEEYSVTVKISIIGGFLAALTYFNTQLYLNDQWHLKLLETKISFNSFRTLLGSLIVIQGFETVRFMGHKYNPQERIKGMQHAQFFSAVIYIVFIALIAVVFTQNFETTDTALISLSAKVASILPMVLLLAAVMSQLSAALADMVGTGGLLIEVFKRKISLNSYYILIAALSVTLTWMTNIFEIISFASRAFAFYYCLQSLEASIISYQKKYHLKLLFFSFMTLLLLFVAILGSPADL